MGFNWKLNLVRILPKKWVSRLVGHFAGSRYSRPFIPLYIKKFQIDPLLAEYPVENYKTLTEFFTRRLKPELRPIHPDADAVIAPVDGVLSEMGTITDDTLIQAKGVKYTVTALLGNADRAKKFDNGIWLTLYLSPKDYHRIHAPLTGAIIHSVYIPGTLWPVNPIGVLGVPGLFTKNERIISYLDTEQGEIALIKVGATIVGSIDVHYDPTLGTNQRRAQPVEKGVQPQVNVEKGAEIGLFKFGSTVILLFPPGMIDLESHLKSGRFVQMGEKIATVKKVKSP